MNSKLHPVHKKYGPKKQPRQSNLQRKLSAMSSDHARVPLQITHQRNYAGHEARKGPHHPTARVLVNSNCGKQKYLLDHDVYGVLVVHFKLTRLAGSKSSKAYSLRRIVWTDAVTVVKEAQSIQRFSLSRSIRIHQFIEWGRSLDFEENFIVVLKSPRTSV